MPTLGILCEKPSQARNFAKALNGMRGVFDGIDYVITAAHGHLYEFVPPAKQVVPALTSFYERWSMTNLPWKEQDFSWQRVAKQGAGETLQNIHTALSACEEIAIATDVDPSGEGELLAWEILDGLNLSPRKWWRFYFDDESEASIQRAFRERKEIPSMQEDPDYQKALYRSKWDMLSMQWTRIASLYLGTLSREGRLKSYMKFITGKQEDLVKGYKKIPYYQWRFRDENGNVFTDPKEPSFPTREEVVPKYDASGVVVDTTERKSTPPPKLIDLASLSAQLTTKGIRAKQVLETYQKMYEDQVVSYPRTEDKFITPEQFADLLPHVNRIAALVSVDPAILTHQTPRSTHVKLGCAHGANRPGPNVPSSLSELTKYGPGAVEIYTILARNYLAMLCEDYIYTHQTGHLEKYPTFTGSANQPVSMGFKLIYTDPNEESEENNKLLGKAAAPFIYEGFPPKPATPTVKWLMNELEKNDIGTGSTRTSTFAEISNGGDSALMTENKGRIALTQVGRMGYLLLPNTHIGSLELTAQVFQEMRGVAEGTFSADAGLAQIQQMIVEDIQTMYQNLCRVQRVYPNFGKRPEKDMVSGTYLPQNTKISFNRVWSGHTFTEEEITALLTGATITVEAVSKTTGKPFPATGKLALQEYKGHKFWGFLMEQVKAECPSDKVEGFYQPKKTVIRFKRTWSGHTFSKAEIEQLLAGETICFDAISQNTGNPYQAKGKLALQTYNGAKFWGFKPCFKK